MLEGIALDRLGLEGEAEYALRAARQAFVLLGDRHREVDSLVHMATFFEKCGQIDDALDLLDWAAETYASGGDEFRWARVSVNRATILAIHRGEFTEAAGVIEEAAKIFERHGAAPEAALAWNNLGAVMHFRGLLDDARSHYEKARDLVADHELRWVFAVATTNLGELEFHAGRVHEARRMHRRALAIHEEIEDEEGAAYDHFRIAEAERVLAFEDPETDAPVDGAPAEESTAEESYRKALAFYESSRPERIDRQVGALGPRLGLARLEMQRQNFGRAAEQVEQIIRDAEELGQHDLRGHALCLQAEIQLAAPGVEVDPEILQDLGSLLHDRDREDYRLKLQIRWVLARAAHETGELAPDELPSLVRDAEERGYDLLAKQARRFETGSTPYLQEAN